MDKLVRKGSSKMSDVKVIQINENIFASNDKKANEIRKQCKSNNVFFINVMSSPGSGKTTMLINLINRLKNDYHIVEMDVDIESTLDASRVSEDTNIEAIQINNGGLCHIDADMTSRAFEHVDMKQTDLIILENIGNLVCPAEFDTGANKNIMILSVPEGDDKPLKYPLMFKVSDLVIISKIDTLDFFDFDLEAAKKRIKHLNPNAQIIEVSAKTNEGMDKLTKWIINEINKQKESQF